MRVAATVVIGILGVALATWGVVQLVPRATEAAVLEPEDGPPARLDAVRSIRFRGDLNPLAVRGQLRTQIGGALDPAGVDADRLRIAALLVTEGHLDAAVRATGSADVVFSIDAGPVYRMGAVRIIGALATRYPALADELTVAAGDDVSTRAIERTQERLAVWLTVHGVTRTLITHELEIDRTAKRVDVTYDVELRSIPAARGATPGPRAAPSVRPSASALPLFAAASIARR